MAFDLNNIQPQQPGLSPSVVVQQDPSQAWNSLPPSQAVAPMQPPPQPAAPTPEQIARLRAANAVTTAQPPAQGMPFSNQQLASAALAGSQRYVPGVAAITPKDIAQKQAWNDKGFVATQGQQSRLGASPEAYEHLQKVQENQQEAVLNQSIADKLQANANLDAAKANALEAQRAHEQEAAAQQQREDAWQQKYTDFQNKYNPENDKVDPNRFFRRAGVLGSIMAVIGAGLEASAAARRGTQNPQTVLRLIDNDIRSQEADIRSRGASANNQLMQLSREWGSIENGKQALRSLQLQAAGARAQYVAARTNDPATKAQIDAHAQAMLAESDKQIAALKAAYGGQLNEQQSGVIMRPQAGRAGGYVTDRGKVFQNMVAANKAAGEQQELDIKRSEAETKRIEAAGKQGEKAQEHAQQAATSLAPFEAISSSTDALAKSVGLVRDQTGKWTMPATSDNPLRGAWDESLGRWSDKSTQARANLRNSSQAIGRALSGAAISEEEQKQFMEMLPSGNIDDAARMNALENMIEARKRALLAGAGPAGARAYNAGKAAAGEMRKTEVTGDEQPYQGRISQ